MLAWDSPQRGLLVKLLEKKKGIDDPNCISDFTPVTETIYTICVKAALPPQVMYFNIDPVFKSILYF